MSKNDELVEIAVTVKRETDLAVLVDDGASETWLPKRYVQLTDRAGVIEIPHWLAYTKGLI